MLITRTNNIIFLSATLFILGISLLMGTNEAFAFHANPTLEIKITTNTGPDTDFEFGLKHLGYGPIVHYTIPVTSNSGSSSDIILDSRPLKNPIKWRYGYEFQQSIDNPDYTFVNYVCTVDGVETFFSADRHPPTRLKFNIDYREQIICNYYYEYITPTFGDTPPPTGNKSTANTPTGNTSSGDKKKNGGGCNDCTAPWLGYDDKGVLKVEGGITINDVTKNGGYYYTEYPEIKTNIGDENTVILKYRENGGPTNIEMLQLASVKEKGTSFGESQWSIEVWLNNFTNDIYNPTIKEIKVFDKDNLLSNVSANVWLDQCKSDSVDLLGCLSVEIKFVNNKVPDSPVLVAEAWDYMRNTMPNFFNHGLQVIDPNYVEPAAPEPYKYECNDPELDTIMNGGDRNNCHWRILNLPHLWQN